MQIKILCESQHQFNAKMYFGWLILLIWIFSYFPFSIMYCRILVLKITPIHIVYVNQYITVVYSRMYCVTDSLLLSIVIKNKCFYYCYTMLSLQTVVNNTFSYLNKISSHILQWQSAVCICTDIDRLFSMWNALA